MKKTLLLLCALFTAWTQASADEMATLSELSISKGGTGTATVTINASGTEQTAFQLFIDLPTGISVAAEGAVTKTATTDHDVTYNVVDNQLRIVMYSMTLATFKAEKVLSIDFQAADDAVIPVTNDLASFAFADVQSSEQSVAGQFVVVEGQTYLRGDANGDGDVDVADIVAVANYIKGTPGANFVFEAANANGDDDVDVADIVAVANIIKSGPSSIKARNPITIDYSLDPQ